MDDFAKICNRGNTLEVLKALRNKLATMIDKSNSGRDVAALSRQLQSVMVQISEIEQQEDADEIGDILTERQLHKRGGVLRDDTGRPLYGSEE